MSGNEVSLVVQTSPNRIKRPKTLKKFLTIHFSDLIDILLSVLNSVVAYTTGSKYSVQQFTDFVECLDEEMTEGPTKMIQCVSKTIYTQGISSPLLCQLLTKTSIFIGI